jgi:DNA-binding transcriptional MerR regulator
MGFFINEYQNFLGNATDLANLASQCTRFMNLPGDLDKINERIVRYYVAEGLVERPERIGRDAQYGYKHLLQFLAGRFLVESGFPMQKVGPYLMTQSIGELEMLVMNRNKPNMAELLVASFQRGGRGDREGGSRTHRPLMRDVDINQRDFRKQNRSDEDRFDSLQSMSLPSNSIPPAFAIKQSASEMYSVDMSMHSIASARDHVSELPAQIHELAQSMKEQFGRIRDEMDKERARSRHEQEQERMEWRKEREALQKRIDQLIAIVAEQYKGKDHE